MTNRNNKVQIKEISTYPISNNILYQEYKNNTIVRSFNYIIIKKETIWGHFTQQTIHCKINYLNKIPQYQICYSFNFQNKIFLAKSTSNVANKYEQLETNNCTLSTLEKWAKNIGNKMLSNFKENIKDIYHKSDQKLAAAEIHLPHEWIVSKKRNDITTEMSQNIQINLVTLNKQDYNKELEEPHIDDPEIIQEVTNTIGTGVQQNIKDILTFLIPYFKDKGVFKSSEPTIYLRISGDGRNVDYHYTIALYLGTEKYDTLRFVLGPFLDDLDFLENNGSEVSGVRWNFKLYFSSDWKFLAICLGINKQVTANYKNFRGHIHLPIFNMISIENYVFDVLHVLLHITDHLWSLMLAEIKEKGLFNDLT
ncbi:41697_t:CDS:2 [Gigaspora margarita]|uniref:41697_t:CDS:1 n=1 Tax=Gigaspora margarita TaxID=4874 RepID=A0ABN7V8V2_GIGMA|nr:41697_t:CDS:2 [Gigaspora margarita]